MSHLRNADELITPAVTAAIAALQLGDEDAATVKLALRYAATIDNSGHHCAGCEDDTCRRESNSWAMRWIGPLLLDALESLGATPAARSRLKGGPSTDAAPSRLHALRAAHRA